MGLVEDGREETASACKETFRKDVATLFNWGTKAADKGRDAREREVNFMIGCFSD